MRTSFIVFGIVALIIIIAAIIFRSQNITTSQSETQIEDMTTSDESSNINRGKFRNFAINLDRSSVNFSDILSGGPGKDGIPALTNPTLISIDEAVDEGLADDVTGIFLNSQDGGRFYPYTILVWHEIVNDTVDGVPVAVTFCPLCGSAITFDRRVGDEVLEFGVSGFLWESNMVMYNRGENESFWSQSKGESIAGDFTGTELELVPMSLITFQELKEFHPNAQVVSEDTGYNRNYGFFPYGNYDENNNIFFPISINDERFFAKEIFYIVPFGEQSIAIQESEIPDETSTFDVSGMALSLTPQADGSLEVVTNDGVSLPGYYEMWFSWAIHHQETGIVWDFAN